MDLNIIINKINDHDIYISYTLRILNMKKEYNSKQYLTLKITKVNLPGKFDQGSIPELDQLFM